MKKRTHPAYGVKTDYRKIDLYVRSLRLGGFTYVLSTTWARTLKEAREKFCGTPMYRDIDPVHVKAVFDGPK